MSESITVRGAAISDAETSAQIIALLNQVLSDLQYIRTQYNSHTHQGVTTGGGTSGTPINNLMTFPQNLLP